eukprot:gene1302-biopygen5146
MSLFSVAPAPPPADNHIPSIGSTCVATGSSSDSTPSSARRISAAAVYAFVALPKRKVSSTVAARYPPPAAAVSLNPPTAKENSMVADFHASWRASPGSKPIGTSGGMPGTEHGCVQAYHSHISSAASPKLDTPYR